jgi:hypothetical protein
MAHAPARWQDPGNSQYNDFAYLFDEQWILGKLEILHSIEQPKRMPETHDRLLGEPGFLRHQPGAPVRTVFRHSFQRPCHDRFYLSVGNLAQGTGPRFIKQVF